MTKVWQRSSKCSGGECVEVAFDGDEVLLRDGKDPDGAVLRISAEVWEQFVATVKDGEFDG